MVKELLESHERFSKEFGKGFLSLIKFRFYLESFETGKLRSIIHENYGKWPHTSSRKILTSSIGRIAQKKFYKEIYGEEPNGNIEKEDKKIICALALKDEPVQPKKPKPKPIKQKKSEKPKKPNRPKKPTTVFCHKVRNMSADEIAQWAKELGATDKEISYRSPNKGLTKMRLLSLVRKYLPKEALMDLDKFIPQN